MENLRGNGSETKTVPGFDVGTGESELDVKQPLPTEGVSKTSSHPRWVAPQALLFISLLTAWGALVTHIYLRLHGMSLFGILFDGQPIQTLRFVTTDKTLGATVEIVMWSGTAVIIRRLVKLARDARGEHVYLHQDLLDAVADYAESIFLTFMLIALFSVPRVTLGTGIDLSLKEASIDVVIALASVLGWSVRETRLLIGRVFKLLFASHGMHNSATDGV